MLTSITLALLAAASAIVLAIHRDRRAHPGEASALPTPEREPQPQARPQPEPQPHLECAPEPQPEPEAQPEPELDTAASTPADVPAAPALRPEYHGPFAAMRRAPPRTYFAIIEIDRFAATRSTVGFEIANAILAVVGQRLRASLMDPCAGRTGQSSLEFTFAAFSDEEARTGLERCLRCVEEPIEVEGIAFRLRATVAFAATGSGEQALSDALVHTLVGALAAEGPERVRWIAPAPGDKAEIADLAILRALPNALKSGELTLHYQPKFDCREGTIPSAEALLRWNSPTLGPVPTQRIILLAEQTGAIHELTLWAVEQASRDLTALAAAGHDLALSVNLSGLLIADRTFMLDLLERIRAAPGRLGVEITETAVIDDPEAAIENLAAFSAAGVPVAIDDFGSGLSSLSYLKRLPAHELKIDRQFVMGLTGSHRDPLIVRASIDLAHALEMTVTAEGVEDAMSLSLLRVMGCDVLQGYFIAKPMPLERLVTFLSSEQRHLEAAEPARPRRAR